MASFGTILASAILSGSLIDLDGKVIAQAILFFIVLIILKKLVFDPMIALFELREERIDGARLEAKQLQRDADEAGETFDEKMRSTRLKAGDEREILRAEGQQREAEIISAVREETQKQLREALDELEEEAFELRQELRNQTPELARRIATQLLQRDIS